MRALWARTRGKIGKSTIMRPVLGGGVAVAVVVLAIMNRSAVESGRQALAAADSEWLILAMALTATIWVVCTVTQLGSMPVRVPMRRLFAVQFAAAFANHILPAGSGGIAVNVRFLQRHGLSRGAAVGAVGLNSLAGLVTHIVLLVAAVAVAPSVLSGMNDTLHLISWDQVAAALTRRAWTGGLVIGGLLALAVAVMVVGRSRGWGRRIAARARTLTRQMIREMKALGAVIKNPFRAAALWLGSLVVPILHAVILFALLRSLGVLIAAGTVVVIYIVVSSVVAVVPSPGGLGGLDVALVAGLTAVGVSSAVALGAVLGYRLLTVWVPLLPGAAVFAFLLRRRII